MRRAWRRCARTGGSSGRFFAPGSPVTREFPRGGAGTSVGSLHVEARAEGDLLEALSVRLPYRGLAWPRVS